MAGLIWLSLQKLDTKRVPIMVITVTSATNTRLLMKG